MTPLAERVAFLLLALAAIHVPLIPVGYAAERLVLPDLLFCLTLAWTVRRPATAPLVAVLGVGVAADLLLDRPPGLGALVLVLSSEAVRARRGWLGTAFLAEWAVATLAFGLGLAATTALLVASLTTAPPPAGLGAHWFATALAYPMVAGLIEAAERLRRRERA